MRILYLNHNLRGRGTWFRCYHFARHLVRFGHEVTIWTCCPGISVSAREFELDGVRVVETPRFKGNEKHDGGWGVADILWRLGQTVHAEYDLVHAFDHRPSVSLPGVLLGSKDSTTLIADWADWWGRGGILAGRRRLKWMEDAEAWWEERQKRTADAVTCISKVLMNRARTLGISDERLLWIPSGADTSMFHPLSMKSCRREFGLPGDAPVIGFAGFQHWDVQLLYEAFGKVLQEFPEARLFLMGPLEPDSIPAALQSRVHTTGSLEYSRMPEALGCADILALPMQDNNANRGRFPGKLAEYLASGRPVVTQDVGDTGAVIRQSCAGVLTESNPTSFADGLLSLLRDSRLRERMSEAGRKYAENHLEWGKLTETLMRFYEEVRSLKHSKQ